MSEIPSPRQGVLPGLNIPIYRLGDIGLASMFCFFATFRGAGLASAIRDGQSIEALNHLSTGLYLLINAFLFISRGPARGKSGHVLPKLIAIVGTWSIVPLLAQPIAFKANWLLLVSSIGTIATTGFIIWGALTLRRNLSIFPEARDLVRHGPYRFIRHPLYAAHILTYALVLLPRFAPLALLFALIGIAGRCGGRAMRRPSSVRPSRPMRSTRRRRPASSLG